MHHFEHFRGALGCPPAIAARHKTLSANGIWREETLMFPWWEAGELHGEG